MPEEEVQQLMNAAREFQDKEQALWENPRLKEALCARLGAGKFDIALEYLTEIKTQLNTVKTELDHECGGTVCYLVSSQSRLQKRRVDG